MNWEKILIFAVLINNKGFVRLLVFVWVIIALFFGWYYLYKDQKFDEISKVAPMQLPKDPLTGYFVYDVKKDKGFGSDPFLSAAINNPIILTGGTPVQLAVFSEPTFEDMPDKSMRKVTLNKVKQLIYVPQDCIEKITHANSEIYARAKGSLSSACDSVGCTFVAETKTFDPSAFVNNSCRNVANLPNDGIGTECRIDIDGKFSYSAFRDTKNACMDNYDFIFSYSKDGLARSTDLERVRDQKQTLSQNKDLKEQQSSSQSDNPSTQQNSGSFSAPNPQLAAQFEPKVSPSFDCAKASNTAEKLICSNADLARLDNQLASLYSQARSNSSDPQSLRESQLAWIRTSRQCTDVLCLTEAYHNRINQLR